MSLSHRKLSLDSCGVNFNPTSFAQLYEATSKIFTLITPCLSGKGSACTNIWSIFMPISCSEIFQGCPAICKSFRLGNDYASKATQCVDYCKIRKSQTFFGKVLNVSRLKGPNVTQSITDRFRSRKRFSGKFKVRISFTGVQVTTNISGWAVSCLEWIQPTARCDCFAWACVGKMKLDIFKCEWIIISNQKSTSWTWKLSWKSVLLFKPEQANWTQPHIWHHTGGHNRLPNLFYTAADPFLAPFVEQ